MSIAAPVVQSRGGHGRKAPLWLLPPVLLLSLLAAP